ncbi:MAG: D-alanyl-D-alanine carboxypeptidase/D-alanyl-D-alanine-endopeptidase, partial [Planctomycetaceae bacterium]
MAGAALILFAAPGPGYGRPGGTADSTRGLETRLDRLVGHHDVGIAVAVGGRIVYRHDARRGRPPASNQKLLLTMALFDALGPSHRLSTRTSAARLSDGVVVGDLWIDGRGDPTLDLHDLKGLVRKLKSRGVRRVAGRVRADTSYFAHDWDAPGWQPYVQDRFMPRPAALTVQPAAPGTTRPPESNVAAALATELRAAGIGVRGHGTGTRPADLRRLAGTRSASVRSLAAAMNRDSDNYVAEMLGKRLGAEVFGAPGTIAKGARAISRWAAGHGVRVLSHDASGLSYTDRVAPLSIVRLLDAGLGEPWGKRFRRSLPGAGEGTLAGRLAGLDVQAKTGTHFNGDSALSG